MVRETEMVREIRKRRRYLTKYGDKEINNVVPFRQRRPKSVHTYRICFADFSFHVPFANANGARASVHH